MILFYNFLSLVILIILLPILIPISLIAKKRKATVFKRLGFQDFEIKKNKRPVWVHALSVGEVISAIEIIHSMKNEFSQDIVFSASTKTGFDMAMKNLEDDVYKIIYFPYDFIFSVKKMLNKINPCLFVLVESDIWPNFLYETKRRKIPAILVNGRLSPSSLKGYRHLSFIMKTAFNSFSIVCVQSEQEQERFKLIGMPEEKILITGNVKFDREVEIISKNKIDELKKSLNILDSDKVLIAGSTHPGEEIIFRNIYFSIKNNFNSFKLIIAPRDPDRAREIFKMFKESNISSSLFSKIDINYNNENNRETNDVLIIDKLGLLSSLYNICDIAFVGGSMLPFGGHNPLEPACVYKPVIFGKDMTDFSEISQLLISNNGAFQVQTQDDLLNIILELLNNPIKCEKAGLAAFSVFKANQGACKKSINYIKLLLHPYKSNNL